MVVLLANVSCSHSSRGTPEVNPPPGVSRFTEERSFDPAVASAEADLLLALRGSYGRLEAQRWKAPLDVSWEHLVAYYTSQLGPEWRVDTHVSEQGSGYRRRVWRLESSPKRGLALAYLEVQPADFAVLIVAQTPSD
jgi:hypothetical protein